jgi:hypothetical protein
MKFIIENSSLGTHKYRVDIDSVSNEKFTENNSRSFYVDVLDSKYKILILYDAIHPDISAIKSVLDKNKNYEIEKEKLSEFNSNYDKYNLVIYFAFSENVTNVEKLKKLRKSDVSLLLLVSPNAVSTLYVLYPEGKVVGRNKIQEVTPISDTNFSKFNVSSNLQNYLTDLPPLLAPFGSYNKSLTSEILLYQKIENVETKKPLIILDNNSSDRKFSIIYAEGLWKWKINDKNGDNRHQNFDELFSKIAQFLLVKEDKRPFTVDCKKEIIEGEKMKFEAKYYKQDIDNLSKEKEWKLFLNNEKDVRLHIKDTFGILIYDTVFSKKKDSSYFLKLDSLLEGSYSYTAKYNNSELTEKGAFKVLSKQKQIESKFYTANHAIVKKLSKASGVEGFDDFNTDNIVKILKDSPLNKTILHSSEKVESIINNKLVLILILLFILIEMVVRRYNGTY